MTGSHVLWHPRPIVVTNTSQRLLCHAFFVAICVSVCTVHKNILLFGIIKCHSLFKTFQYNDTCFGKSIRGFVICFDQWFFSNLKICILTLFTYWHVSSLYWDIDQVRDTDTCHAVSHNVTWRPCQISWQPCHVIIDFIYKSKYLITKENIQSQWFLKSLQIYFLFSCLTNCEVCPPGWHINVLSYKFSSQAPKFHCSLKYSIYLLISGLLLKDVPQQISTRLSLGQTLPFNIRIMLIACGL